MGTRELTEAVYGSLPDDYNETPETLRALDAALLRLHYRERLALCLLFGLNGESQLSRPEVAARLPYYGTVSSAKQELPSRTGVKLETLAQVEAKALRKLRHPANRWISHCPWCHRNGSMVCTK
jgi:DNA-directed RNA polymerase sigma subunit (sigma70/sigma32)